MVALRLDAFVLKLLMAPRSEQQAATLGLGREALGDGLLTLKVDGIDVRMRTVQHVGKSVHVAVGAIEVHDGIAGREGGAPIVARIEGDPIGDTPDEHVGGTPDHPGDILPFILARRQQLRNPVADWATGIFGAGRKPKPAAAHAPERHSLAAFSPPPPMARRGSSSSDRKDSHSPVSVPSPSDDDGGAADASPLQLRSLHLRRGPPAIRLFMLSSASPTRPHECVLHVGRADAAYFPSFFARYDTFMRVLERVKHSSVLGASAAMRARFARLTRGVNNVLAEKWHVAEAKLMTAFLSVADLFDMPSAAHALSVALGGVTLRLYSEKDAHDELMALALPAMHIARTPRVGEPTPPRQKVDVTLDGAVQVSTPIRKRALARVLQAQHAGTQGYSRMGGRLMSAVYSASNEVATYRERLRRLDQETERLRLLFNLPWEKLSVEAPKGPDPSVGVGVGKSATSTCAEMDRWATNEICASVPWLSEELCYLPRLCNSKTPIAHLGWIAARAHTG